MSKIFYYLLYAFTWLLSLLPFWIIYRLSDVLYLIISYIIRYRKKNTIANLKKAFPEKSYQEIMVLTRRFYRHFCDFLLESMKGISIPVKNLIKRYQFINLEIFHNLEKKHKSIALVSGHYNNWEWMIPFPLMVAHKFLVIYRPLKNKAVDQITKFIRSRCGAIMVPMEHIYREAFNYHNSNQIFTVWFLADQRPPRSNKFWTLFLNQEVSFYQGAEKLARKLDLAVVFMDVQKLKRGYYQVVFKKLIDHATETRENEITLACVKEIEKEIHRQPEYWLWSHKRFKHKRPEDINLVTA